ncbi:MAG: hypothetical protein AAGD14_06035 [Planctomycetota bacterium]
MTGPHPLPPDDREDRDEERSLQAQDQVRDNAMGATFQAMAEALRANAEALHKIDNSQQRMADSMRRQDKVTQVVTSTKALNETFRGLSEIQRGLLETLVRDRNGRGGSSPWAFLVIALLAGLLSVLVWERLTDDGRLPRELYEQARRRNAELASTVASAEAREKELEARATEAQQARDEILLARASDSEEIARLRVELKQNKAQVANYLAVKDRADAAGALMLSNEQLQRDNGELKRQVERMRQENERLWKMAAENALDSRMGDPEAIIRRAKEMKAIPETKDKPMPSGGMRTPRDLTMIRRKLTRLLEGGDGKEGYEVLKFADLDKNSVFKTVEVGRYEKHMTIGSIQCEELEVRVDPKKDTVELRFRKGHLANLNKPNEKIALDPEGHSVYITGVDVVGWLEWAGNAVSVGEGGLLLWK